VLYLGHPRKRIRDTSKFTKFRQITGGRTPSLKKLSERVLAVPIQAGEHNSVSKPSLSPLGLIALGKMVMCSPG